MADFNTLQELNYNPQDLLALLSDGGSQAVAPQQQQGGFTSFMNQPGMSDALLNAGMSMLMANNGNNNLAQVMGAGAGGFGQGLSAYQRRDMERQALEQKRIAQMLQAQQLAAQIKREQQTEAERQAFAAGLPEGQREMFLADPQAWREQNKPLQDSWTKIEIPGRYGMPVNALMNTRTGEVRLANAGGNSPTGGTVPAYDAQHNPISVPDGIEWNAPTDLRLPNGELTAVQWNKTGEVYRPVGAPAKGDKTLDEATKAEELAKQRAKYAQVVVDDINRVEKMVSESKLPTTGVGGVFLSNIPGTMARDISSAVETIKGNIGFDRLQEMRAASPTGGALGQVSDFENKILQATIGNLSLAQTEQQFLYNLRRVKDIYQDILNGVNSSKEMVEINGEMVPKAFINKYGDASTGVSTGAGGGQRPPLSSFNR